MKTYRLLVNPNYRLCLLEINPEENKIIEMLNIN